MATRQVHCPLCNEDITIEFPDDFTGTLRWEHGCPPQDVNGDLQAPYQGIVQVGEPDVPVFAPVPDGVVVVTDHDEGTGTSTDPAG